MAALDLTDIVTAASGIYDKWNNQLGQIDKLQAETNENNQKIIKDNEIVTRQAQIAELTKQQNDAKAAASFGVSPEMAAALGQQYLAATKATLDAQRNLAEGLNSSNVLTALGAFVTAGPQQDKIDELKSYSDQMGAAIQKMQTMAQEQFKINAAVTEVNTAQSVEAKLEEQRLELQNKAIAQKEQNLKYGIQLDNQRLDMMKGIVSLEQSSARLAFDKEQHAFAVSKWTEQKKFMEADQAMQVESHGWSREEHNAKIQMLKEAEQARQDMLTTFNKGAADLGIGTAKTWQQAEQFIKLNGQLGEDAMKRGNLLEVNPSAAVAATPAEVVATINRLDKSGISSPAAQDQSMNFARALHSQAFEYVTNPKNAAAVGTTAKDKETAIASFINKNWEGTAAAFSKDVTNNSIGNPYKLYGYDTVLKAAPELAESDFYKNVVAPLATATGNEIRPQDLFQLAKSKIASGEVNINDAASWITRMGEVQVNTMINAGQLNKLGIPIPAELGFTYKETGSSRPIRNVSLTDYNRVLRELLVSESKLSRLMNPFHIRTKENK